MKRTLAVSCGDVNGIGIECLISALEINAPNADVVLVVNIPTLRQYINAASIDAHLDADRLIITDIEENIELRLHNIEPEAEVNLGTESAAAGALAIASLETATRMVVDGAADALVTLPVSKAACTLAGWNFPGQTEMLGALTNAQPMMILCADNLRVALATVHLPLSQVSTALTQQLVREKIQQLSNSLLRDFSISPARIAVLSLNPHAGENGILGTEELAIIKPAIDETNAEGPFAADGFFGFGSYEDYDGILAMYHDQGLIPLKLLAQGGGVNFTAGLPIVRTSPDHGTAFAIAGTGAADPTSTIEALHLALSIADARRIS